MSLHGRHTDRITDEAAMWFVRAQDPDFSCEDRKELAFWLAGSAEHVREYLLLAAVTQDVREAAANYDVDEIVALACTRADDVNIVALPDIGVATGEAIGRPAKTEPTAPRRRSTLWATAATMLLAVAVSLVYFMTSGPDVYITGVGEQLSFPLDDGSVITLNAQSTLSVDYSDTHRDVELAAGEAMFDVAKDPDRPFRVMTERAVIQAVGTQFNVRHRGVATTVTVVEGIVDVTTPRLRRFSGEVARLPEVDDTPPLVVSQPQRLTVGQQVRVAAGEVAVLDTNVEKATSWRERRLVFESWSLQNVVNEFNLFNEQRFVIHDLSLAQRSISGAFSADDRDSFALFLKEAGLARPESLDDGTIVLRSADKRE